jgi:hypothetical protein
VIRIHVAEGNLAEAVRAYEEFCIMLAEELGLEPSEHMTRLLRSVRPLQPTAR